MDNFAHSDCTPVAEDPTNADLFDGTAAAPPRVKERYQLNSSQQATLDRLMAKPIAMLEVNALRIEQVTRHGHSDESDADTSFIQMLRHTRERLDDAIEFAQQARSCPDLDRRKHYLRVAHRKTAIAAAMALANMDRLTAEVEGEL